ncbi:n-acetylgalactosamine 6-sulfate sulfatase : Sulfatase OS=Planctomyces brasiliensis (strain ATCC 49424 / DSM 5305 / JCM 21570 / NBRC 103401 / IFAM 1448) GN=Plabr_1548 PE=4 SV=1: Sulfatase [Gemmataceae bacterium]|nr:n-acetylgalactosamine 6-sulfate sulfatase : Sulfatase OS=Planctomyces brasiliensis (strain ATCC 49424 / DSM 5305 / JCM 21570 / NBRC 103401 / IFAM 1448) GN=Plabr_1548 PE=4 SV=1: Sulfatase [Gemmataceae bacterium]VTT99996.1 n-acetylgalactosamine 6-sulfate sulfatase : Sulfatase OS=Planctomyces brasiliensis (strain ATCC 49424 / DSM 5305 / JCM 21570 / NBRC 103401 / IFAM 1448) GN=Plabr_1548 PE=4 SV=1: Sulfatase [Gemmataceae bacterium]
MRCLLFGVFSILAAAPTAGAADPAPKPNIVVILADDIGWADLGCFGQKTLATPNLDRMAKEGMRLTQFYAGGATGGPSRRVMLTGRHGGRAATPDQPTVASLLKKEGYATACVGQWGLGPVGKLTAPNDAGFDHFFGALNAPHANNPYPEFLVRNGKVVPLKNEAAAEWKKWQDPALPDGGRGVAAKKGNYAPALLLDDALGFVREHRKGPFFLYLPLTVPHANAAAGENGLEVPDPGEFAAKDWPAAEKGFAAQVRAMDRDVGRVLDLLRELKIDRDTLVLFASDNGPHTECGHKPEFFQSTGKMRGTKGELFEGSIRVPAVAWWPGTVAPGTENNLQWYAGDLPATAAELAGVPTPAGLDSDSLVPMLKGREEKDQWKRKSPLYWETSEGPTAQAVRFGKWKAIRSPVGTGELVLYDMSNDTAEKRDYSKRRPDLAKHALNLLDKNRAPDPNRKGPEPAK